MFWSMSVKWEAAKAAQTGTEAGTVTAAGAASVAEAETWPCMDR